MDKRIGKSAGGSMRDVQDKKDIALFLGCVIPNRYPAIEHATNLVLDGVLEGSGIDVLELKGASCCPAPGVFRSFDKVTWLAVAARNIALAEELDADILTICNGCFGSLSDANLILKEDAELAREVNAHLEKVGRRFKGTVLVRHIIEYLHREIGVERIRDVVTKPLGLRVAVHYGCHLVRPSSERHLGSQDYPMFFDELVEATGAESVDYPDKMVCCGAGGGVRSALHDTSMAMVEHKLDMISGAGVDCIVDACPFCHLQFDGGQVEIAKKGGKDYGIPVLHYTQLLALAMGYSAEDVGLSQNAVVSEEFMDKIKKL